MMPRRLCSIIAVATLLTLVPKYSLADLSIAYPPDKSLVTLAEVAIVGTTDESGTIHVRVDGGKSLSGDAIEIVNGGFSATVQLSPGQSLIQFAAPSGQSVTLTLAFKNNPSNYPVWQLHDLQPDFSDCTNCHRVSERRTNYKRMAMGVESCRSDVCHGDVGTDAEFIHGPVAGGVCISCHNPHGSQKANMLTRSGAEQCFICHEDKRSAFDKTHQHTPVKDGECTACHDPHQSDHRYQLRESGEKLCYSCHDQAEISGGNFTHSPVESGDCNACHNPHASDFRYQLMAEGNDVCFECHEGKSDEMALRHIHPPVEDDCGNCHDPHTGPAPSQLSAEVPQLCWECHSDLHDSVNLAVFTHPPVENGDCGKCHNFHASEQAKLLQQDMVSVCSSCHVEMGEKLASNPNLHGPVADNDCSACHALHGGEYPKLLVEYFPPEFYNQYQEGLYGLCFECHNPDIARDRETTTLTDFRDGNRNLHFLHINSRKGRSCKACHDIHASDQEKHIRRSVPFGPMYEYPIQFTKTQDGGGCLVGCHKPRKYSRSSTSNR